MPSAKKYRVTLTIASDPKEVGRVEIFLEKVRGKLRLDETRYNRLLVATTEAVNNSIIHGNKRDAKKKVVLICELVNKTLIVHVEDEGAGIDPAKLPNPLAEENLLRENGRGVFLMRSLMDRVSFEQIPGHSSVIMKIKIK